MQHLKKRLAAAREDDGGFTLIELLVVIVIIGILSAVVIFSVVGINDKGEEAACEADLNTLKVAEEAFYADNGHYTTEQGLLNADLLEGLSSHWNITPSEGAAGPPETYQEYAMVVQDPQCTLPTTSTP